MIHNFFVCPQFVFCRDCLQGYHIDECLSGSSGDGQYNSMLTTNNYVVDPQRASQVCLS